MSHQRFWAFALKQRTPPAEVQLWDVGANPTDFGVHKWTERSADIVMSRYAQKGKPIQIDVEHGNAEPLPAGATPPPSAGYAELEIRAGAPWLKFQWSKYGAQQIQDGERLFLSPEYDVDRATGEITRLVRVSLVADPATHHARMLASAAHAQGDRAMDLALILAALQAAISAEDPAVCKQQVTTLVGEMKKMAAPEGAPAAEGAEMAAAPLAEENKGEAPAEAPAAPAEEEKKPFAASAKTPISDDTVRIVAKVAADSASMQKRLGELEAENRVLAAGERIPEALRGFARGLDRKQFDEFVAGLPEQRGAAGGIKASAKPTRGTASGRPEGELPAEDAKYLARAFHTENAPTESITITEGGRLKATHLARPAAGAANGGAR